MESEKKYDIVILGASGYTGQFVLEEVGRLCKDGASFTYAVAGRSQAKLQSTLENASRETETDFSKVDIIITDVNDADSLKSMAQKGKIIINCVGPYRFYGKKVIEACIEAGADHLDISGEPQYLEEVQLSCSKSAYEKKVYVVGSCGFDSIPADMGTLYFQEQFGGDVNSVDMVVGLHDSSKGTSSINVTTLECALHGYSNRVELGSNRRELFKEKIPRSTYKPVTRGSIWWCDEAKRWCFPNLASDRSVVLRTQQLNYKLNDKRPLYFNCFFGTSSMWTAVGAILFGLIFAVMAPFSFTRKLFLRFPSFFSFGIFTKDGPKREDLRNLKFCVTLIGHGWNSSLNSPNEQHSEPPNVTKIAQVVGPDPGYAATAIFITQCAMTLLQERDKFPKQGGVFTPGSAFLKTTLIERLRMKGIEFKMLD